MNKKYSLAIPNQQLLDISKNDISVFLNTMFYFVLFIEKINNSQMIGYLIHWIL